MEPAIPTGQEILEQLNRLVGEYAVEGNNSTIGGGREGRTNADDSRLELSSSAEDGAKSPKIVGDDNNVATPYHPITSPRLATPAPAPGSAPTPATGSTPAFAPGSALRSALWSATGPASGTAPGSAIASAAGPAPSSTIASAAGSAPGSSPGSATASAPTLSSASAPASAPTPAPAPACASAPASASAPALATDTLALPTAVPTLPAPAPAAAPVPAPALTAASLPLSTAVTILAPPPAPSSAGKAPISSRLRARPEKSQKARLMRALSRNKTKGSLKRGRRPKRRWSRPKGPRLLSKT